MKRKKYLLLCALGACAVAYSAWQQSGLSISTSLIRASLAPAGSQNLIIEPDDTMAPVYAMIENASSSVDVELYNLSDPQVEQLLAGDAARGVVAHVLLNGGYYAQAENTNASAYQFLQSHGVAVKYTPAYFALTHEKALVVDNKTALIMSFNLQEKYYKTGRDFGVVDTDAPDVAAIDAAFNSDWTGTQTAASNGDDLLWSPGAKRATLALINGAAHTLYIYNEEMDDADVEHALEAAAQRGVKVEVVMTSASEWNKAFTQLTSAGVLVSTYSSSTKAPLYIHAKMIVADGKEAFVGSQNFSEGSLNDNRELGLIISNPSIINSLTQTFDGDFANATPFAGN